jgi:two-component system, cell cycle response regulator
MLSNDIKIALCGLSARDQRMVQIVLTQTRGVASRHLCQIVDPASALDINIIVVDERSAFGMDELQRLHARHPGVVPIYICDDVAARPGKFRLPRRTLLVDLLRIFDAAVDISTSMASARQLLAQTSTADRWALPIGGADAVSATPEVQQSPPLTALVVDDSAAVRVHLYTALLRIGIFCILAADAEEALLQATRRHFDLVFLDITMPGKDGYQLCKELVHKPYTRSAPILILTSRSSPFDRARGVLAGCSSYLVKPVDPKTFYGTVDKMLMRSFHNDCAQLYQRGYRQQITEHNVTEHLSA